GNIRLSLARTGRMWPPTRSSQMAKKLPPVHPGEILREEFLVPLKLTPYAVAAALHVRRSSLAWRGRKRCSCRDVLAAPERAGEPRAGDRSPRRAGAIPMVGEDVRPQSLRTRPLWRGGGRLKDFGIMKVCP